MGLTLLTVIRSKLLGSVLPVSTHDGVYHGSGIFL